MEIQMKDKNIFTIGDKIETPEGHIETITGFFIDKISGCFVTFTNTHPICNHPHGDSTTHLNSIKHAKQPLFTTEDGHKAFEGEQGYAVICDATGEYKVFPELFQDGYIDVDTPVDKWFMQKEAANNYCKKMNKKVLFKTEDGVDIYEGDSYHTVCSNWTISSKKEAIKGLDFKGFLKDFSTKEKAEEYIIMNKPCLSLNDINENWVIENKKVNGSLTFKKLKELVKSKLK